MTTLLRVLLVGDIVGRPGRQAAAEIVPELRRSRDIQFVIANGENSAHGKGFTHDTVRKMLQSGIDVITAGNHTWDNKDIYTFIEGEPRLIRPENFGPAPDVPGRGWGVFDVPEMPGIKIGVFNMLGRVLMRPVHCPFHGSGPIIEKIREETPIIILDFHAETTSEKISMGWFLDGEVSCVYGTHTHVQTADETILPRGTAYITDLGMTGGHTGVIGVKYPDILRQFMTNLPVRHEVADEDVILCGAIVTIDVETGRAEAIERVREPWSRAAK
jgi:metallophosphoesterase (TIGR00282 family)